MGTNYSRRNKRTSKQHSFSLLYIIVFLFLLFNTVALSVLLYQSYSETKGDTRRDERILGLEQRVNSMGTDYSASSSSTAQNIQGTTAASTSSTVVSPPAEEIYGEETQPSAAITPEAEATTPSSTLPGEANQTYTSQQQTDAAIGSSTPAYSTYVVKTGDSLSIIAETYGISVSRLMEINGLSSDTVVVGQELLLN